MKSWIVVAVAIVVGVMAVVFVNARKSLPPPGGETAVELQPVTEEQTVATNEVAAENESVTAVPGIVKEFTVTGSPFKFEPSEIRVKKGDTVKVTFKNMAGTHNFTIDQFEVESKTLGVGEQDTVQFKVDRTGTFEYYCSVDTHKEKGMVGKLIVE